MILADGVGTILLVGFLLFCLLDVITSDPATIRNLPKVAWVLLVFVNPIGGVAWLIAGRPLAGAVAEQPDRQRRSVPRGPRRRDVAPDDDPDFLSRIKPSSTEHEQLLGSWEDDLRRREEELRRRDHPEGDSPS